MYHGDIHLGDTIDIKFVTTSASTGAPTTLSGVPVISAYIGNSTTELTAGITLTVDFDTRTGLNNVRVVATSGNGYGAATNVQLVITTGTVGGTSAVGYVVGTFSIDCRGVNQILGTAVSTPATAGILDVNTKNINNVATTSVTTISANQGTTQPLNFTGTAGSALVKSDMVDVAGAAVSTSTAQLGVNVVNFGGSAGTFASGIPSANVASGGITDASFAADASPKAIATGTAQAGAATTITLAAGANANNNFYNNTLIKLTGGTGVGQSRFISGYVGATKVATVATWVTNPDATTTYDILPFDAVAGASAPTAAQVATAVWQDTTAGDFTTAGSIGKSLFTSGNAPGAASGLALVGSNMGSASSVTGAVGSVTGNVGGNVVGSVASVTARVTANTDQLAGQTVTAGAGVTFPSSVASPTNITAGTITTVTNLTNAPTAGDFTATMKTSIGTAVAASAVASVTGNVGGNVTGSVGSVVGAVGSVTGNVGGNVVGTVASVVGNVGGNVVGSVASVSGNVGGNVVGSVGSVTAGVSLAANSVDSTAVATSGAQEIATAVGALSLGASNNNFTLIQGLTVIASAVAGKVSGEDVGAPAFRDLADTKDVISGTDTGTGNRTAITYNP